jgi:hypothetical protein
VLISRKGESITSAISMSISQLGSSLKGKPATQYAHSNHGGRFWGQASYVVRSCDPCLDQVIVGFRGCCRVRRAAAEPVAKECRTIASGLEYAANHREDAPGAYLAYIGVAEAVLTKPDVGLRVNLTRGRRATCTMQSEPYGCSSSVSKYITAKSNSYWLFSAI